jgi:hypothetical protein
MTMKDKINISGSKPDKTMIEEIRARISNGTLSCLEAFSVAERRGVDPIDVGHAADALKIKLSHCQLGLFGYDGEKTGWGSGYGSIPEELEAALKRKAGREGRIPCPILWDLAETFGLQRIHVGWAADRLGIKVEDCQLGAF